MGIYKRGNVWWYRFTWKGRAIRESTKQSNRLVAEHIEAARKTEFAKGEVGFRDKEPALTLREFGELEFLPFIESKFQSKAKTLEYCRNGFKNLNAFPELANCALDEITVGKITAFATNRRRAVW